MEELTSVNCIQIGNLNRVQCTQNDNTSNVLPHYVFVLSNLLCQVLPVFQEHHQSLAEPRHFLKDVIIQHHTSIERNETHHGTNTHWDTLAIWKAVGCRLNECRKTIFFPCFPPLTVFSLTSLIPHPPLLSPKVIIVKSILLVPKPLPLPQLVDGIHNHHKVLKKLGSHVLIHWVM